MFLIDSMRICSRMGGCPTHAPRRRNRNISLTPSELPDPAYTLLFFSLPAADSVGSSTLSSPLTNSGGAPHNANHHHHTHGRNLSSTLDPLDILTGEGLPGPAAMGWSSYEASGESNLVASGMDKVGELDAGEVRNRRTRDSGAEQPGSP